MLPFWEGAAEELETKFQETGSATTSAAHAIAERLVEATIQRFSSRVEGLYSTTSALEHRLGSAERLVEATIQRFSSCVEGFHKDQSALEHRLGSAERLVEATIQRFSSRVEGLYKDQSALAHRLGSIEAQLHESQPAPECAEKLLESATDRFLPRIEGLYKDQVALGHRLASLEEQLEESRSSASCALSRAAAAGERLDQLGAMSQTMRDWLEKLSSQQAELHRKIETLPRPESRPSKDGELIELTGGSLALATGPMGRYLVRPHDLIGEIVLRGDTWEPHLRDAIERFARSDRVAIDVGAYIGLHTTLLSRAFREVHAFEPQEEIFRILCGNLVLNDCRNVRTRPEPLYDRDAWMRIAPPDVQEVPVPQESGQIDYRAISNAAALTFECAPPGSPGAVHARTLDSFEFADVGFIKIDAQGADVAVLRGAIDTIKRCRPVISFEFERNLGSRHGGTMQAFTSLLDDLGYRIELLAEIRAGYQADYLATPVER
jgi:FkbM family methyltransferase